MCTNLFNVDEVHKQGELTLCNYTLLFQSPDGAILSYPCVDDASSTVGLDANNTITTLNGIHRIKLPFDDNTKLIRIDRRFFLDKYGTTTCTVTNVNNTTYNYGNKGLIELTVQQDTYNEQTDKNGVCNYFEPTVIPPTPVGNTYSDISCSGELVVGGSKRTLTTVMHNADGTINTSVTPAWDVVLPVGYEANFTTLSSGYNYYITIAENYDLIDMKVIVNVSDGSNGFVGNLTMSITA